LLYEVGGDDLELMTPHGVMKMGDALPHAFGPRNLT
jgi:hypothetical protein